MSGACADCLRRSWLLAALSGPLEYAGRGGRLISLLALSDIELMRALAGRRAAELRERWELFQPDALSDAAQVGRVCRHDRAFPATLRGDAGPWMLHVADDARRLRALTERATVAIVGSARASDYGREMAQSLARGLAAAGVVVVGSLGDGVAGAALRGALEGASAPIAVVAGGVDVAFAPRQRSLRERVRRRGCVIGELPCGVAPRRWSLRASERIVAALASVTVVVEADDRPHELAGALLARALGRTVAALPGRVTSPTSRGTHALLIDGARLVRGAEDVLELLGGRRPTPARTAAQPAEPSAASLAEPLRRVLDRVGEGREHPDDLIGPGADRAATMLALSELEVMGLLARVDGGRYVPRQGCAGA
jgi:DNA processing protein